MGAQGKIDWDTVGAWQKLVSAIIATGIKVDIRAVATHYGTTYDTLENRLRKIKKDAAILKDEVQNGARGEVISARKSGPVTPKKPKTVRKGGNALGSVATGRISKSSPSKKSPTKAVKEEFTGSSVTDIFTGPRESFVGDDIFNSQSFEHGFNMGLVGMGDEFR